MTARQGLMISNPGITPSVMSLAEIEKAVKDLKPAELTKLAAYIVDQDKLGWDEQLEEDFSPGGKHSEALRRIAPL